MHKSTANINIPVPVNKQYSRIPSEQFQVQKAMVFGTLRILWLSSFDWGFLWWVFFNCYLHVQFCTVDMKIFISVKKYEILQTDANLSTEVNW